MGIDFDDASGGSTPSTFDVTVKEGDTTIGQFQFQTDQLPEQNYIGVWTQVPFDRLEIRETTTANENEFFGTVSISQQPLQPPIFADGFESNSTSPRCPARARTGSARTDVDRCAGMRGSGVA